MQCHASSSAKNKIQFICFLITRQYLFIFDYLSLCLPLPLYQPSDHSTRDHLNIVFSFWTRRCETETEADTEC